MMRRTPLKPGASGLKRSGFKARTPVRPEREERARPVHRVEPGAWRQMTKAAPLVVAAIEKHTYVRSKKLREAYRLIPCQHCGRDDGTVCCAHSNWAVHGKGGSIKADDNRGASLCASCHVPILDQGSQLSREERREMWWSAHVRSIRLLVSLGHWPEGVPVPDVSVNPWSKGDQDGSERQRAGSEEIVTADRAGSSA